MDAFEFIVHYETFINEIEQVIRPELLPVFEKLKEIDPHDLVTPEIWFVNTNHARGFVWNLFLQQARKSQE
ncbi:MAG: hypothetical protein WCH34_18120 [Bacteroidota bacterium]